MDKVMKGMLINMADPENPYFSIGNTIFRRSIFLLPWLVYQRVRKCLKPKHSTTKKVHLSYKSQQHLL